MEYPTLIIKDLIIWTHLRSIRNSHSWLISVARLATVQTTGTLSEMYYPYMLMMSGTTTSGIQASKKCPRRKSKHRFSLRPAMEELHLNLLLIRSSRRSIKSLYSSLMVRSAIIMLRSVIEYSKGISSLKLYATSLPALAMDHSTCQSLAHSLGNVIMKSMRKLWIYH